MLNMLENSGKKGLVNLEKVTTLMAKMAEEIKTKLPKIYSKDLIEIIFKIPYTKRQFLIGAGLGTPKKVGNYLMSLGEKGYLKSVRLGKEKLYLSHELMKLLEGE